MQRFYNIFLFVIVIVLSLLGIEGLLRVKNQDQKNYVIEMWRYAKLLKIYDDNTGMGHEHIPNQRMMLENVEIRLNSYGLRGPEMDFTDHSRKRILFLGSSNTFGWGVEERKIMTSLIQDQLRNKALIVNAGVCNYNSARYVHQFKERLRSVHPDIVVVHGNIRDAEELRGNDNNFILRHSQLMAMSSYVWQLMLFEIFNKEGLADHYIKLYSEGSKGFQSMVAALKELDDLSKEDGFKVIYFIIPEPHFFKNDPFSEIHDKIRRTVETLGWTYIDPTEKLRSFKSQDLWVMPSDAHYNALGQRVMADILLPYLRGMLEN